MLTQRTLATYLLERNAHSLFTVKNNQPTLLLDIALQFATKANRKPDFAEQPTLAHGRIEQRAIWTTTALNDYVNFPGVGQVFMLRRTRLNKATGKTSIETAYGVTSHTPDTATAHKLLSLNRGHWCIENTAHHCLDWSFDEDRCRIRTGYGPENVSGHCGPWLRGRAQCDGGSWWCGPRSDRRGASANSDFHIRGVSSVACLAGCTLIRWSTSTR